MALLAESSTMPAMDRREIDRALADLPDRERAPAAPAQAPEVNVSALLSQGEDGAARPWLRLALVVALAAIAIGAGVALWPRKPRHEVPEMDFSTYLPPIKTEKTASGEETSPFTGFAVSIDTDPAGAVVSIGGVVRGEAPVLANVSCRAGDPVEVRAERQGFAPARRQVACRADTLVKLTLRLER
jgi:hypothetical protein